MKCNLILLLVCFLSSNALAQSNVSKTLEIGLAGGYNDVTFRDELLNDFSYNGHTFNYLSLSVITKRVKSTIAIYCDYTASQLLPQNLKSGCYQYNYVNNKELNLLFIWLKTLNCHWPFFTFKAGLGDYMTLNRATEYYQSHLYEGASGYKSTFLLSVFNLSPTIEALYSHGNHTLWINGYYSLLSLNGRPDDIYVRQIENNGSVLWRLESFMNHQDAFCSIGYKYLFCKNWMSSVSCGFSYRDNSGSDKYSVVTQSVVVRIIKPF